MMQRVFQTLYSQSHYLFRQIPDFDAYIQNREQLTYYDLTGVTIKRAEAEDFHRLAATVHKFQGSTRIADRTRRGDVCVVAYKHGALAHVRWAAVTPIPAWGRYTIHLAPDEAYTYDSYTVPAFRRQGISSETRVFLIKHLAQQGIRRTYSDTRTDNIFTHQRQSRRLRKGREYILGVITVTTVLNWTR
jgi:GNAT superfamily N-acetyltransferase